MNYKDSGVDIDAGNAFVEKLKTKLPHLGGFNGMIPLPSGYDKPVLVSGADGVGTKLNICKIANDYTTIGIDLVAMCVNDVICTGAHPLYFLDYISTKSIDDNVEQIVEGIIKGCELAEIELLGGETAEHFHQHDYDLAGFCTGVVEQNEVIDGKLIKEGDKIIGIPSNGLHINGYTIINQSFWQFDIKELLTPTAIYWPRVKHYMDEIPIVGMAHITGGGLVENVPRILPKGLKAEIDYNSWERPEIFNEIKTKCNISEEEMRRVFNLGIGFCLVVPPETEIDGVIGYVTK